MRIGIVAPRQAQTVGGGFTFIATVLGALNEMRKSHEVVLLDLEGVSTGEWTAWGLPLINVQAMFPPSASSGRVTSATELAAFKLGLDVVWYLDPLAEVFSTPVFATVLDLGHRQHPFFPEVSLSGWDWESRESHYRRVLPRAARIFTGTETGKAEIVRCYGVNPANVIVNPFPAPTFTRVNDPSKNAEVLEKHALKPGFLFYPAQFWPHKNHINLLLAVKQLEMKHGLTLNLVLTGADKGNLAHVKRIIEQLNLQERVHILGFVPVGEIAALYQCAAALVFPSFLGPDNLPPLEAFALGCPVMTARVEGVEEQLGRGAAVYFDPARPEDIAAVVAKVLRSPRYRARLIKSGHEFNVTRTPEAYVQVVLRALDEFEPWRRSWPAVEAQTSSAIRGSPADLADAVGLHKGVFADGWLENQSSFALRAPSESMLSVHGEVPYFCDPGFTTELSICIDGLSLAQTELAPGKFVEKIAVPGRQGWHRIDLAFSRLQRLPDPDTRSVGAKLDFIGFGDANAVIPALKS